MTHRVSSFTQRRSERRRAIEDESVLVLPQRLAAGSSALHPVIVVVVCDVDHTNACIDIPVESTPPAIVVVFC
jgi:hypothetical protein